MILKKDNKLIIHRFSKNLKKNGYIMDNKVDKQMSIFFVPFKICPKSKFIISLFILLKIYKYYSVNVKHQLQGLCRRNLSHIRSANF